MMMLYRAYFRAWVAPKLPRLSVPMAAALALGAAPARMIGAPLDMLPVALPPFTARRLLRDVSEIDTADDAQQMLGWLLNNGSRGRLGNILEMVGNTPSEDFERGLLQLHPREHPLFRFVWQERYTLMQHTLTAWDAGRAVHIARIALSAGYLREATFWGDVWPLAERCRAQYTSWEDFAVDYARGERFERNGGPNSPALTAAHEWLLRDPRSPWQSVAWAPTE
jgi:hypothetical protein